MASVRYTCQNSLFSGKIIIDTRVILTTVYKIEKKKKKKFSAMLKAWDVGGICATIGRYMRGTCSKKIHVHQEK